MAADAEAPAVGLVVVTELCLLQSAALRRRIKEAGAASRGGAALTGSGARRDDGLQSDGSVA
jgi:hypothetical protein